MKVKKPLIVLLVTLALLALALLLPGTAAAKVDVSPSQHYAASGMWTVTEEYFDPGKEVGVNHDRCNWITDGIEYGFLEGTAVIRTYLKLVADGLGMGGRWTVVSGTEGLRHLHGMGTFVFMRAIPDPDDPEIWWPQADYTGEVGLH